MNQRVTPAPQGASASDGATYWMMRKMSGSMDASERAAFAGWLSHSPENADAFSALEERLADADEHGETLLAAEFERQIGHEAIKSDQSRRNGLARIAATLAAAAFVAVIAIFARGDDPARAQSYATAIGEAATIALEDGSEAELNTGSRIEVAFDKSRRLVALEAGEAFFNVEKDRARPFVVTTEHAEITVTGTSFSVSTFGDNARVNVLTGVVDVAPLSGPSSTLLAGDTIEIDAGGRAGPVERYDPSLVLAWRSGKARFRDEPLGKVVVSLNRYFETPIELADPALADLPVTGEFDIRDRDTAVRALALIFNLESREEPARIILSDPRTQ